MKSRNMNPLLWFVMLCRKRNRLGGSVRLLYHRTYVLQQVRQVRLGKQLYVPHPEMAKDTLLAHSRQDHGNGERNHPRGGKGLLHRPPVQGEQKGSKLYVDLRGIRLTSTYHAFQYS